MTSVVAFACGDSTPFPAPTAVFRTEVRLSLRPGFNSQWAFGPTIKSELKYNQNTSLGLFSFMLACFTKYVGFTSNEIRQVARRLLHGHERIQLGWNRLHNRLRPYYTLKVVGLFFIPQHCPIQTMLPAKVSCPLKQV